MLFSNAVTFRRDKAVSYSANNINIISIIAIDNLNLTAQDTGIEIFRELFHATSISQNFKSYLYIISSIILILAAFYPKNKPKMVLQSTFLPLPSQSVTILQQLLSYLKKKIFQHFKSKIYQHLKHGFLECLKHRHPSLYKQYTSFNPLVCTN